MNSNWKDGKVGAGNWKICSECGREYDGSDEHECLIHANDLELERQANAAGMSVDDYMEAVLLDGRKPEVKSK